jgi:hypothetical protein
MVGNDPINQWDYLGLNACEMCGEKAYDPTESCCIKGSIHSKQERITIKVCRRPANFIGGNALSKIGINHEFMVGPDGPPVG